MKQVLLLLLFSFLITGAYAQAGEVQSLPAGKYETLLKDRKGKWDRGDLIILDDTHYRLSSSKEVGEYRFSATAQRLFFMSGPLKSVFAKTARSGNKPAIIIPAAENEQQGMKLAAADVWGYYRQ